MTKKKPAEDLQKRGRKPIEIDYAQVEKYSSIMCTQSEIASLLGVSLSLLEHDPEFLRIHKKGMDKGKSSLRRMQYVAASKGNATMLIWLGKQHLGQRDKQDVEFSGEVEQTVIILPSNSRLNNTDEKQNG